MTTRQGGKASAAFKSSFPHHQGHQRIGGSRPQDMEDNESSKPYFFEGQWPKTSDVGLKLISNLSQSPSFDTVHAQNPPIFWITTGTAPQPFISPRCQTTPDLRHVLRCQWCQYICWPPPGWIFSSQIPGFQGFQGFQGAWGYQPTFVSRDLRYNPSISPVKGLAARFFYHPAWGRLGSNCLEQVEHSPWQWTI